MPSPKKTAAATAPPPATGREDRMTIVNLKGSPEYAAWLEKIHRKTYIPKTTIFRLAMAAWAEAHGHEPPPEI